MFYQHSTLPNTAFKVSSYKEGWLQSLKEIDYKDEKFKRLRKTHNCRAIMTLIIKATKPNQNDQLNN